MITPSVGAIAGLVAVIAGWMERRDCIAVPEKPAAPVDDLERPLGRSGEVTKATGLPPLALPAE